MYRQLLGRLSDQLERTLRMEQRLTVEECYQLFELSESIVEYGRMIRAYHSSAVPYDRRDPRIGVPLQRDTPGHQKRAPPA
jgi:hypothetical protein